MGRIYDALNNVREVTQSFAVNTALQNFDNAMSAASLTGPNSLPTTAPYNDDVKNLLKYAFKMNLSGSDSGGLVPGTGTSGLPSITSTISGATTTLRVEFISPSGSGLVYTPKRSTDLSAPSWVTLSDLPTVTPIDANWERLLYEETLDTSAIPICFGVVEVTLP